MTIKNWLLVYVYDPARNEIVEWPIEVKKDLGSILTKLQKREKVGMPDVRTMPSVAKGCSEIRLKDVSGIFRVFYVMESKDGVFVFHAFKKKTEQTSQREIETARKRLKAFLKELQDES
jgi:phage-related protein